MNETEANRRITYFIDSVVLPRARPLPGVPLDLRDSWASDDGWYSWKAIPSQIKKSDVEKIGSKLGIKFPPLFVAYFLYKQILDGDYGLIRLPDMMPPDPISSLRDQVSIYFESKCLQKNSLVPFGQDGNDGGPICFKIDQPTEGGDHPIYFVDHELLNNESYSGIRMWDSFD